MGCDVTSVIGILAIIVSIHAPTWGATSRYFRKYCGYGVSIHAPTWGATYEQRRISETAALFQSTHPHGVRRAITSLVCCTISFNPRTHMGCDGFPFSLLSFLLRFNPRTHMGCDAPLLLPSEYVGCFNPRTHMGCDIAREFVTCCRTSFNPRTHMGCDNSNRWS